MINFCGAILRSILPFPSQLSKPFPGPDSPIDVYVDSVRLLPEHILLAKVVFNHVFGGKNHLENLARTSWSQVVLA